MRHLSTALLLSAAALPSHWAQAQPMGYPQQGRSIVCESQDGGYRECATGFRGGAVLVENLSSTRCVEGGNWGNSGRGGVWVREGCRARFAEAGGPGGYPPGQGGSGQPVGASRPPVVGWDQGGQERQEQLVRCESDNGSYRECRVPGRARIELVRQLSDSACVEGRTWGTRGDRVWVNRGCRAEFAAHGGAWSGGWDRSVICASEDQQTITCPWNSRADRPRLLEQLSSAACREGQSWGTTRSGDIWVSRGCRGRFGAR
ncbi:MAG: DUF3011 domain-containing protein [Ottowia sp.]|uniref:DUF3011 domain-containing protein n=1 Tax=Ottowia sp. TaxID=1898956 RepID=UPI0039E647F3